MRYGQIDRTMPPLRAEQVWVLRHAESFASNEGHVANAHWQPLDRAAGHTACRICEPSMPESFHTPKIAFLPYRVKQTRCRMVR